MKLVMTLLTFKALIHTSALFTVANITVNSIVFGGNWSRPSGYTALHTYISAQSSQECAHSGQSIYPRHCPIAGPVRVAQLVERLPSKPMYPGSIPRRRHDPAVGWGDTMFEKNGRLGMLAGVFNTRERILATHFTFTFYPIAAVRAGGGRAVQPRAAEGQLRDGPHPGVRVPLLRRPLLQEGLLREAQGRSPYLYMLLCLK